MKLKNLRKALRKRISDNEGLMGMLTLWLLLEGWNAMMEKDGSWLWGLIIFSAAFFNCIPYAVKLIDGKGIKKQTKNEEK
jgi:hypothetical protein